MILSRRRYMGSKPTDKRIVCTYVITDDSVATQICYAGRASQIASIEIDGVLQSTISESYNLSAGTHVIKFGMKVENTIAQYFFSGIGTLTEAYIPDNFTTINRDIFSTCSKLETLRVPTNMTSIPIQFIRDTNISSFEIPQTVTSIGANAFQGTKITEITVPSGVTSIAGGSFRYITSLTTFIILATTPPSNVGNTTFQGSSNMYIYVPDGYVDTYKSAGGWSGYSSRIKAISELNQ